MRKGLIMPWWLGGTDDNSSRKKKGQKSPSKSQQRDQAKATSGRGSLNKMANQAAREVGLNASEKQAFHRDLTSRGNNNLSYGDLLSIARGFRRR